MTATLPENRFTPYTHELITTHKTEVAAKAWADFVGAQTGERTGAVPYWCRSRQAWIWAAVAFH